jgi:hypothetical protein
MNATIALQSAESGSKPGVGSHNSSDLNQRLAVVAKGLTLPAMPRIPSRKFFRQ